MKIPRQYKGWILGMYIISCMYFIRYGFQTIPIDINSLDMLLISPHGNLDIINSVLAGALIGVSIVRIFDCTVLGIREIYIELTD